MTEADITHFLDQLEDGGLEGPMLRYISLHPVDFIGYLEDAGIAEGDVAFYNTWCCGVRLEPNVSVPIGELRAYQRDTWGGRCYAARPPDPPEEIRGKVILRSR